MLLLYLTAIYHDFYSINKSLRGLMSTPSDWKLNPAQPSAWTHIPQPSCHVYGSGSCFYHTPAIPYLCTAPTARDQLRVTRGKVVFISSGLSCALKSSCNVITIIILLQVLKHGIEISDAASDSVTLNNIFTKLNIAQCGYILSS